MRSTEEKSDHDLKGQLSKYVTYQTETTTKDITLSSLLHHRFPSEQ